MTLPALIAPDARPVLVGLPPGARHELAALAFATAARRAGMTVHYLGADLPAAEWMRAARSTDAAVAVIGVPTSADADAARAVARSLRRGVPGLVVAFGGDGAIGMRPGSVLPDGLPNAVSDLQSRLANPDLVASAARGVGCALNARPPEGGING